MTVLFDTNVLLDVLLDRTHAGERLFLLDRARDGSLDGVVTPTVVTNAFYVGRSTAGAEGARDFVESVLSFLVVSQAEDVGDRIGNGPPILVRSVMGSSDGEGLPDTDNLMHH